MSKEGATHEAAAAMKAICAAAPSQQDAFAQTYAVLMKAHERLACLMARQALDTFSSTLPEVMPRQKTALYRSPALFVAVCVKGSGGKVMRNRIALASRPF